LQLVDELVGTMVAERYLVQKILGMGGIGKVYQVADERVDRSAALKVLLPPFTARQKFSALLDHEARVTDKLRHAGILRVYDRGEFNGLQYMVSELIQGCSLREILRARQMALELQDIVTILRAVGDALNYAHSKQVVHRDIKPSNVLIANTGAVFLTDFGIATIGGHSDVTEPGAILDLGTWAYMSPEQAAGSNVDSRSDLYSLALIVYECMTKQKPFGRETSTSHSTAGYRKPILDESAFPAHVPNEIRAVIRKALNQVVEERYETVQIFIDEFTAAAGTLEAGNLAELVSSVKISVRPENRTEQLSRKIASPDEPVPAVYRLSSPARLINVASDKNPGASLQGHEEGRDSPPAGGEVAVPAGEPPGILPSVGDSQHHGRDSGAEQIVLLIRTPDGKSHTQPLPEEHLSVGRSSANDLCYPDDAGLSRRHLVFERSGRSWVVRDVGSKNGTMVNGFRITGPATLKRGDTVSAGHLRIEFTGDASQRHQTVVFVEEDVQPTASVGTSLEGLMGPEDSADDAGQTRIFHGSPQTRALIKAGLQLAKKESLEQLFQIVMDLLMDAVGAGRGVLMSLENGNLVMQAHRGDGFQISADVRDRVLNEGASLLIRDAQIDKALRGRRSIVMQSVRSMMAVPLQTNDRVIGLIYVDTPNVVRQFTPEDLNLLTVMANVAATRIEHARLAEVERTEQLMAKELQQAAEIQRGLLPTEAPIVSGFDIAGQNYACRTVGGDYYDFLTFPDGRVGMIVADVAGKGMPASLLMSSLQARVQVLFEEADDLANKVAKLNRIVKTTCPGNRFITFFICVLDPSTGHVAYCNAGHNPPLLVRASGEVKSLPAGGLILGILPFASYDGGGCKLDPGDTIVLYSDGVTEAASPTGEEFGETRLAEVVRSNPGLTAMDLIQKILADVNSFTTGAPAADDMTLIVIKSKIFSGERAPTHDTKTRVLPLPE
jgi:serine phosphatase RsbU (regulator of sigma subunit)/serine/threonine protein kinase